MGKSDIKKCRYIKCNHHNNEIDITVDEYKTVGKMYYHADCYKAKNKQEWKDEETRKDLQYIKLKWIECISDTVPYSQLLSILNDYVSRGVSSKYLVFVMDYVIAHKMNLHYPNGFKYFVDKGEIKMAYKKKQAMSEHVSISSFKVEDENESPTFAITKKPVGFQTILSGGKK